jgi:putative transcriptional regulator
MMMTKSAFDKILAGAEDALSYAKGNQSRGVAHVIPDVDVRAIRTKVGGSREAFAARFGLDMRAVQDWEQQRRTPDRATRVLMLMIENEPKVVERVVKKVIRKTGSNSRARPGAVRLQRRSAPRHGKPASATAT